MPINELKKQIRFLAITVLHTPPAQECEREREKDGERNRKGKRKKEGRKGGRGGEGQRERGMAGSKRCLNGIRMAGWLADCLTGGSDGCLFASPLVGWLAKVSDGWPAACMTACHPALPSSRSRCTCLPSSLSYAAPLGQVNYPLARIPICFRHSHQ